jgi:hypothetical protein
MIKVGTLEYEYQIRDLSARAVNVAPPFIHSDIPELMPLSENSHYCYLSTPVLFIN